MYRVWSFLFLLVPVAGMAAFLCAIFNVYPLQGAWLPGSAGPQADSADAIYNLVHWICALFFVGLGLSLAGIVWRFASTRRKEALYLPGSNLLEVLWSLIPGAILVFIAFSQVRVWNSSSDSFPTVIIDGQKVRKPAAVQVVARQFGWEFHYPGRDGQFDTIDDFSSENELVVPDDEPTVLGLRSRDVIHSFFVPRLRLKQDVVPGMYHEIWVDPDGPTRMNILCAELCGGGHYRMNAILKAVSREEFVQWIELKQKYFDAPTESEE